MVARQVFADARSNLEATTTQPAISNVQCMENNEATPALRTFLEHRDRIRAGMQTPQHVDQHVGIAVFEAWADGFMDDAHLAKRLAVFHAEVKDCSICSENLEFYRTRRKNNSQARQ